LNRDVPFRVGWWRWLSALQENCHNHSKTNQRCGDE
jgi:hypothetical protein